MKTTLYNPSPLEKEFAHAILELKSELQKKIQSNKILEIEDHLDNDNPSLVFKLKDADDDTHVIVMNIIQRIDE